MLTQAFSETIQARLKNDQEFAIALFNEAITLLLNGEPELARLILRDLVNATIGFETLANLTHCSSKSLDHMLSPEGNPTMDNLTLILGTLQRQLNLKIVIQTTVHS